MAFAAFHAQEFSEVVAEFNAWRPEIERSIEAFRGNIMMQGAEISQELEAKLNAVIRCESRTTQVEQVGNQAVAQLDAIKSAFRVELLQMQAVLSQHKPERLNEQEALKADLRILVSLYNKQFLTIEASIAAAAATSSPTTQQRLQPPTQQQQQDPWHQARTPPPPALQFLLES